MKKYLTLLFLLVSIISYASGDWGSYRIQGIAKHNGKLLINECIKVKIGDRDTTINTDNLGFYSIVISWSTFHSTGQSYESVIKKNPKYIYFTHKKSRIKVKNDWQKSRSYFLYGSVKNATPIKYEDGKYPQMFGEIDCFTTPNIYVEQKLNFRK